MLTASCISYIFVTVVGMKPRSADIMVVKTMGGTPEVLAEYLWDHWMGEPAEPTLEKVTEFCHKCVDVIGQFELCNALWLESRYQEFLAVVPEHTGFVPSRPTWLNYGTVTEEWNDFCDRGMERLLGRKGRIMKYVWVTYDTASGETCVAEQIFDTNQEARADVEYMMDISVEWTHSDLGSCTDGQGTVYVRIVTFNVE